ncbi:unnamed protein product [Rhizophagus irregularis]|nr:unnamed protein product [Rhizophagus irregularis]
MHNSQNITNELLNKGRNSNTLPIYGISQNPDTRDYIIVIQDEYCEKCDITEFLSEDNEYSMLDRIDNIYGLSQNPDTKDYIMILKDEYCEKCVTLKSFNSQNITDEFFNKKYNNADEFFNEANEYIALKCLLNSSQNIIDEFLNEIRAYSLNYNENIIRIYGLSQNPDTKDYIIVLVIDFTNL